MHLAISYINCHVSRITLYEYPSSATASESVQLVSYLSRRWLLRKISLGRSQHRSSNRLIHSLFLSSPPQFCPHDVTTLSELPIHVNLGPTPTVTTAKCSLQWGRGNI